MILTQERRAARTRVSSSPLFAAAAALAVYIAAKALAAPLSHDQSWYLFAAHRMLNGALPYGPEIAETNPPLILWFSVVPVFLARLLPLDPTTTLRLITMLLIGGSTLWSVRLIRRHEHGSLVSMLLGCVVLLIELSPKPDGFGQREHLFVILAVPWILAVAGRVIDRLSPAEQAALGIMAGLAVCFKPQEALVLVALELFLMVRTRSIRRLWSWAVFSALLTAMGYLLLVHWLTPLYGTRTLPLLLDTYWAYGTHTALGLIAARKLEVAGALLLALLCFLFRRFFYDFDAAVALFFCSLGAFIAYCQQHTNWGYHLLPFRLLGMLAVGWLIVQLLSTWIGRHIEFVHHGSLVTALGVAVVCCGLGLYQGKRMHRPASEGAFVHAVQRYPAGTTVYMFSTSLAKFVDIYEQGLDWGSRFPCLWLLPGIVQNKLPSAKPPLFFRSLSPEKVAALENMQRTESAEDLSRWKPVAVLVDRCTVESPCQGLQERNFDILAWFKKSPAFAAAWSSYRWQGTVGPADLYTRVN